MLGLPSSPPPVPGSSSGVPSSMLTMTAFGSPYKFHFLWNLGYILTSIMKISRSNDVPILVEFSWSFLNDLIQFLKDNRID